MRRGSALRAAAVLGVEALVLHRLRFTLGYRDPGRALAAQGHAYLSFVTPAVVLTVLLAAGRFAAAVARVRRGATPAGGPTPVVRSAIIP